MQNMGFSFFGVEAERIVRLALSAMDAESPVPRTSFSLIEQTRERASGFVTHVTFLGRFRCP